MRVLLTLLTLSFLAGGAYAAPQAIESDTDGADIASPRPDGDVEALKDLFEANGLDAAANADPNFGIWHCTAYAEGHGHSWGYDYRDIHYNHAYYGAMQRCEYMTGHHCHDVHCHYDHH